MASPENQHCASCIGTVSFTITAWLTDPLLRGPHFMRYKSHIMAECPSVRPSVCLSRRSTATAAAAASGFAAEVRARAANIDRQLRDMQAA